LRKNRAQIAQNRAVGWFYSRSYWIAVRFWGRAALWKRARLLPTPPHPGCFACCGGRPGDLDGAEPVDC